MCESSTVGELIQLYQVLNTHTPLQSQSGNRLFKNTEQKNGGVRTTFRKACRSMVENAGGVKAAANGGVSLSRVSRGAFEV